MNIVKIMGGLGNQLFGYAFAKHLERCGEVFLDISWFDSPDNHSDKFPERKFLLDHFTTEFQILKEWPRKSFVDEEHYNRTSGYNNGYFWGYWQKGSYSKDLNLDIQLLDKYISKNMKQIAEDLAKDNSVAVHVRHGDYTQFNNWTLNEDYYIKAAEKISEHVKDPHFYIFTDDTTWTHKHIFPHLKGTELFGEELEDFYWMTKCKHNIIANSTYSFWAAMLNKNPDKLVIYPEDWKCGQRPVDFEDKRWISV